VLVVTSYEGLPSPMVSELTAQGWAAPYTAMRLASEDCPKHRGVPRHGDVCPDAEREENHHGPGKADVEKAMHGHILAKAELIGTYEKRQKPS